MDSWRSAYVGLLPADYLAGLDPAARGRWWRESLERTPGPETVLATSSERVVGFVSVGPPLTQAAPGTAWLYALYVVADRWGTGLGHRLHEDGVGLMRAGGYSRAELWVLRTNTRAVTFYERHGWTVDGREQIDRQVPGVELDEVGMSLILY